MMMTVLHRLSFVFFVAFSLLVMGCQQTQQQQTQRQQTGNASHDSPDSYDSDLYESRTSQTVDGKPTTHPTVFTALFNHSDTPQTPTINGISLLGYGIRQPGEQTFSPVSEGTLTLGTEFAILYQLDNSVSQPIEHVTIYPDSGIKHPSKGAIKFDTLQWTPNPNQQTYELIYLIEHGWEIIPGRWVLQVKSGPTVYLEKVFYLNDR